MFYIRGENSKVFVLKFLCGDLLALAYIAALAHFLGLSTSRKSPLELPSLGLLDLLVDSTV
jgi:hypothetical protein